MGNINVFTGPMKCGKTNRLIDEVNKLKYTEKKISIFKPQIDNRFANNYIIDRNGNKISAINISKVEDLLDYSVNTDIYVIDEFQFLDGDVQVILDLVADGKCFYITGLNLTAERKPFGRMGDLLCIADNIVLLTAVCENCHQNNALLTFCKIPKTGDILVGDNVYMPLCIDCYNKLKG